MGILFLLVVLSIGLLVLAVIMPAKKGPRTAGRPANRVGVMDRELVARKWQTIESMSSAAVGGNLRDAVSEADKLLDYALKHTGARGETMGERLKNSGSRFSNINAIWSAHKVRNALAHEAEFDLVPSQAREAIASFKQGLKDLGAL